MSREKRRHLEYVDDFRRDGGLRGLVNVGQHRHAQLLFHAFQHNQPIGQPGPAKAVGAGAVRLVEARLENVRQAEFVADAFDVPADSQAKLRRLDHARAGDDEQRRFREVRHHSDGTINGKRTGSNSHSSGVCPAASPSICTGTGSLDST